MSKQSNIRAVAYSPNSSTNSPLNHQYNSFKLQNNTGANEISGYLYKKSSAGVYQRRYFEVNGSYLTYYKTEEMKKLLAALSIPQVGSIRLLGELEGGGAEFAIDLKDRQYVLKADSLREAERWVEHLLDVRDVSRQANSSRSVDPSSGPSSQESDRTPLSTADATPTGTMQKSSRNCCSSCWRRTARS